MTTTPPPNRLDTPHGTLPRDPTEYRAATSLKWQIEYMSDPSPTGDIVHELLTSGAAADAPGDGWMFEKLISGTRWRLVVDYDGGWTAVGCFAPDHHTPDFTSES
jgi:hypothetical protein